MATAHITPQALEIQQCGRELYQHTIDEIREQFIGILLRHGPELAEAWADTTEGRQLFRTAFRLKRMFPKIGGTA